MSRLNPDKLFVEYREGVTEIDPVIPRRYTLTHSDVTAQLFLTIGTEYATDKINIMRDEVLGEWSAQGNGYLYFVYLYVDGILGDGMTQVRNMVFRRELPLALEAIRYGDSRFFEEHIELDEAPIIVYFLSSKAEYNKAECWGNFIDYKIDLE